MYTEGFESLEEAEQGSRRTYGNTNDAERLQRENDKLKKSLEKEQFFNKLLDQEIQELKVSVPNGGARPDFHSEYWQGPRGVSKGAFYLLLFVTLILGGYIGYGIYYNKPMNYLNIGKSSRPATVLENEPTANEAAAAVAVTTPVAKDSVPNIIGQTKPAEEPAAEKKIVTPTNTPPANTVTPPATNTAKAAPKTQKAAVTPTADEEYNEDEVNRVINADSAPVASAPQKPAEENRPVIARYKVTSKANFYNSADENSMRGTFISGSLNKVVDALEEKNGFIFVVYTNDLGFTSKGWLSKQDLAKE